MIFLSDSNWDFDPSKDYVNNFLTTVCLELTSSCNGQKVKLNMCQLVWSVLNSYQKRCLNLWDSISNPFDHFQLKLPRHSRHPLSPGTASWKVNPETENPSRHPLTTQLTWVRRRPQLTSPHCPTRRDVTRPLGVCRERGGATRGVVSETTRPPTSTHLVPFPLSFLVTAFWRGSRDGQNIHFRLCGTRCFIRAVGGTVGGGMTTTTEGCEGTGAPAGVTGAGGQRGPVSSSPAKNPGGAQLGFPRPTLLMDVVSLFLVSDCFLI